MAKANAPTYVCGNAPMCHRLNQKIKRSACWLVEVVQLNSSVEVGCGSERDSHSFTLEASLLCEFQGYVRAMLTKYHLVIASPSFPRCSLL